METIRNKINEIKEQLDEEYEQNIKILQKLDELELIMKNLTNNEFREKKKKGPKHGGWSWSVNRYELYTVDSDDEDFKLIGAYPSYKEMLPAAQQIYPNIDADSIKYLVLGRGHKKFKKLRVKYCDKTSD